MDKTLGQVGYEAMLKNMLAPEALQEQREYAVEPYAQWENQPQMLKDDWEKVAQAIAAAALEPRDR